MFLRFEERSSSERKKHKPKAEASIRSVKRGNGLKGRIRVSRGCLFIGDVELCTTQDRESFTVLRDRKARPVL